MGDKNEARLSPLIKQLYGQDLTKTISRYDPFDYVSSTVSIELKSRNNNYSKYPTTMIGLNKIDLARADETTRRYIFLFAFLDGLYEWEYSNTNYEATGGDSAIKSRVGYVKYNNTNFNPNKPHLYIPIEQLKRVGDLGCSSLNNCIVN